MQVSGKPVGFWSAVSLGVGAMIGAGIFALLGQAGAIAGSAVYLSFIIGGVIAMLSGYSLGKMGARYPAAGGIVEYLAQGYGVGVFTGAMSIMLFIAAVVSLALVAKTFGAYAYKLLPEGSAAWWRPVFSVSITLLFMAINLRGARDMAFWERLIVLLKFTVLTGFAVVGVWYMNPVQVSPQSYPPAHQIFFSLAITFFAFEGFRVITNAAEDMPNPQRTLPLAMMTAILLVGALYVAVSFAVFGSLTIDQVIKAEDYALAQAAVPVFGSVGFTVVAITALLSTASSINANLYAVTNVTYQLAKDGELPAAFGEPIGNSREGLLISGALVIVLTVLFDLGEIAAIGSISILFIHGIVHLGHLRITAETGASRWLVALALLATLIAAALALVYESRYSPATVLLIIGFVMTAFILEFVLQILTSRKILPRVQ